MFSPYSKFFMAKMYKFVYFSLTIPTMANLGVYSIFLINSKIILHTFYSIFTANIKLLIIKEKLSDKVLRLHYMINFTVSCIT